MKIIQITVVNIPGFRTPWVIGLGEDSLVYVWREEKSDWKLFITKEE